MIEIKASYGPPIDPAKRVALLFGAAAQGASRLNVGCGGNPIPGWTNLDKMPGPGVDLVANLNTVVFGEKDCYDVIYASHVLEHVENPVLVVFKMHELLKPEGRLLVVVPYAWSDVGLCNPFHQNYFTPHTFVYFLQSTYDQFGTPGYQANEGLPIAPWAKLEVEVIVPAEHVNFPKRLEHEINIASEVIAVLTKRGSLDECRILREGM